MPAAVGADVALALARAAGGDDGAVDLLPDGFYDSGAEAQRLFEYPLVLHGGGLSGPLPGPLSEVDFLDTKTLPAAPCIYLGLFTCPVFGSNPQKHPKSPISTLGLTASIGDDVPASGSTQVVSNAKSVPVAVFRRVAA